MKANGVRLRYREGCIFKKGVDLDITIFTISLFLLLLLLLVNVPPARSYTKPLNDNLSIGVKSNSETPTSTSSASDLQNERHTTFEFPSSLGDIRTIVFILVQVKNHFDSVALGALIWVALLELTGLAVSRTGIVHRHDFVAREMLRFIVIVFSITLILILINILVFSLLWGTVFKQGILLFQSVILFLGLSTITLISMLYLYYFTWTKAISKMAKWVHASLGIVVGALAAFQILLANSWGPMARLRMQGSDAGSYWPALFAHLWDFLSLARLIDDILLGAAVLIAYAAYQATAAITERGKDRYNSAAGILFLGLLICLLAIPWESYWLKKHIDHSTVGMGFTYWDRLIAQLEILRILLIMVAVTWPLITIMRAMKRTSRQISMVDLILVGLLTGGIFYPLGLLIYSFYTSNNLLVGRLVSVPLIALMVIITGFVIALVNAVQIKAGDEDRRRDLSNSKHYGWIFMAIIISLAVGLSGYIRSAITLLGGAVESFDGKSHTLGFAMSVIIIAALLFWCGLLLIFRLAKPKNWNGDETDEPMRGSGMTY